METKEYGAQVLRSLTEQNSSVKAPEKQQKHVPDTMAEVAWENKESLSIEPTDNISMIAQAYGIKPLVMLLTGGSSVAQRDAAGALANIARGRLENQERIIASGGVKPLAIMLRAGDASAQEQAAAALASVTQNLSQQKAIIESSAVGPLVNLLKGNNVCISRSLILDSRLRLFRMFLFHLNLSNEPACMLESRTAAHSAMIHRYTRLRRSPIWLPRTAMVRLPSRSRVQSLSYWNS